MKFSRLIIACLCAIAFAGTGWSQNGEPSSHARVVPGYINPQTGVFTPLVVGTQGNSEAVPAAATKFTGTFVVNLAITVKSSIPANRTIECTATAQVEDTSPTTFQLANFIQDSADAAATRSSGTASCTLTIPYSWFLTFAKSDTVTLSYDLNVGGNPSRDSTQYYAEIPVPSSGTTTHENVSVTF